MGRRVFALAMVVLLVGCEQENQPLPFDPGMAGAGTISSQGGTVSTPAGAAVHFPAGALTGTSTVTVSETEVPSQAQAAGTTASGAFAVEATGAQLVKPAEVELKLRSSDAQRSWLASVVSVVGGELQADGSSRVNLGAGIVSGHIRRLGTVLAVIPSASAVFPVQAAVSAALMPEAAADYYLGVTADSVSVQCGGPDGPCTGLSVTATQNLLELVADAALLFPRVEGVLRIGEAQVTGVIEAQTSIRILLESEQAAETFEVNARLEGTAQTTVMESASEIRFTQVRHAISGSTDDQAATEEEVTTLIVPRTGSEGSITIRRTFDIETTGGAIEPATVTITIPVTIHG